MSQKNAECPEHAPIIWQLNVWNQLMCTSKLGGWIFEMSWNNAELPEHQQDVHKWMSCWMSEMSKINIPNVIHVMGVSGISERNHPGVWVNFLKKCWTSWAPPSVHWNPAIYKHQQSSGPLLLLCHMIWWIHHCPNPHCPCDSSKVKVWLLDAHQIILILQPIQQHKGSHKRFPHVLLPYPHLRDLPISFRHVV